MKSVSFFRHQGGVVLIVALIMLTLVTLIAISSFNMTKIDLQIGHNAEVRAQANSFAQLAIDEVISSGDFWLANASTTNYDANGDGTVDVQVVVSKARCIWSRTHPNPGRGNLTSEHGGSDLKEMVWELRAEATDVTTGSKAVLRQGVSRPVLLEDLDDFEAECEE